jgi:hypothetical protein
MKRLFAWMLLLCLIPLPAISATLPLSEPITSTDQKVPAEVLRKKIAKLKIKDLQKMTGRKFSLKEKIAFLILKKKLKQKPKETSSQGQTALIFGIAALALLVIGLFVPFIIIGSLVTSIIAIVLGSSALKKDPNDRKAYSGKLLGWISLGVIVVFTILAAIIISSLW